MKTTTKTSAKVKSNATRSAVKRFKEGQTVKYEGKTFKVRKDYDYKNGHYCIIVDAKGTRKQVSANSLV